MATMDYEQENGRYDSMLNLTLVLIACYLCSSAQQRDEVFNTDDAPQTMSHATIVTGAPHLVQSVKMTIP